MGAEVVTLCCPQVTKDFDRVSPRQLSSYHEARMVARRRVEGPSNLIRPTEDEQKFDTEHPSLQVLSAQIADKMQQQLGSFLGLPTDQALGKIESMKARIAKVSESLTFVLGKSVVHEDELQRCCTSLQQFIGALGSLHGSLRPSSGDVRTAFMLGGTVQRHLIELRNAVQNYK